MSGGQTNKRGFLYELDFKKESLSFRFLATLVALHLTAVSE